MSKSERTAIIVVGGLLAAGLCVVAVVLTVAFFSAPQQAAGSPPDPAEVAVEASPTLAPESTTASVPPGNTREQVLKERLSYLDEVSEISWVEIDGNNVYIGFRSIPEDYDMIVRAAAFHGNNAIDFGVHVWAIDAKYTGWRPGQGKPFICEATARYGRVQDSNCN
jgi:hypothetical protein